MSNSTITYDAIVQSQASKEVTANAFFDAASQATAFGRRASTCSGLTWGYYGANLMIDGGVQQFANGTVALSASTTNYLEASRAGAVSKNTTGFTPGAIPLYVIVTGVSTVTSYTDYRTMYDTHYPNGRLVKAMADANQTLSVIEAFCDILEATGALTATRDMILPLGTRQWTVFANTTGFGVRFIGASGTGITVAVGKRAIIYADGTNVVRVTADT